MKKLFVFATACVAFAGFACAGLVNQISFNDNTDLLKACVGARGVVYKMPGNNTCEIDTSNDGLGALKPIAEGALLTNVVGGCAMTIPQKAFLSITHGVSDAQVKNWCLVMRFNAPKASVWYGLVSLDMSNAGDAYLFIRNDAAGGFGGGTGGWTGYTATALGGDLFNRWNTLVLSVTDGKAALYVNGEYVTTSSDKFSLEGKPRIYIGADNDGEDNLFYLDYVRIYDESEPSDVFGGGETPTGGDVADALPSSAAEAGALLAGGEGFTYSISGASELYKWEGPDSTGTFTVPEGGVKVDVLMVGGGGAGGMVRGGGGGGGGLLEQTVELAAGTYTVKVGAGGLPQVPTVTGGGDNNMNALKQGKTPDSACGGDTVIALNATPVLTAVGGGGGGNFNYNNNDSVNSAGLAGGSGGGAGGDSTGGAVGGTGTTDQGSDGGKSGVNLAGGGGGAGAVGRAGGAGANGDGGAGKMSEISGAPVYYAAGGGAGGYGDAGKAGVGGEGGGGNGSVQKVAWSATAGADGFGGGGGGGSGTSNNANYQGGARGGSGIVYMRVLLAGMVGVTCSVDNSKAREITATVSVTASDDDPADTFDVYAAIGATQASVGDFELVEEGLRLNVGCEKIFGGLDAGADYVVAVKAKNRNTGKWSDVVYSSARTSTTVYPVTAFGPGIVRTASGYEVSISVSAIQDGVTEVKATLNGVEKAVAAPGMYTWQVPASGNGCSASVELSYLARGIALGQILSASVSGEGSIRMVETLVGHDTADTAFVMNVGDKIILPEPEGDAKYVNLSGHRFLGFDGRTVEALEPGIGAVEQYATDGQLLATAAFLVKPTDMQAGGRIFVFDAAKSSKNRRWGDEGAWYCVETGDYTAAPNGPKDVAFVLMPPGIDKFGVYGDYTVQDIFFGRPSADTSPGIRVTGPGSLKVAGVKVKNYSRPGTFMICACGISDKWWEFYMTPYNSSEKWTLDVSGNDVVLDLGGPTDKFYPTKNSKANQVMLRFDKYIDIAITNGCKLTLANDADRSGGRGDGQLGNDAWHFLTSADSVTGEGVFEIRLAGVVDYGGNFFRSFKGEILSSVRNFVSGYQGRDGAAFASESGNFNSEYATMTLAGYVKDFDVTKSVGTFSHGANHGWTAPSSQTSNGIASAGFKLNGGYMRFYNYAKTLTDFRPTIFAGKEDYEAFNETAKLTVAGGLSEIDLNVAPPDTNPIIHLHAKSIGHEDSGSLFVYDARTWKNSTTLREMAELEGFSEHFVGNTETVDEANDVFPIIPWMVTRYSSNSTLSDLWWAHVGADNVMCRGGSGARASVALPNVVDPLVNAYCKDTGVALTDDVTVNSLMLEGGGKTKELGEGRVLTITSGGLIIRSDNDGIGSAGGGSANGSLVFPNRAYVWATSTSDSSPDVIWTPMTSPNGFCMAGFGQLRIGGDQTGIDGDLTVNNGTLQLGDTSGNGCTLDVPVNLVGGNTKLVVNKAKTLNRTTLNLSCPGGYGPQISVPTDGESCYKIYVDGESLPRGVYGAPGSGAPLESEFVAAGSGLLTVLRDDKMVGFKLSIR